MKVIKFKLVVQKWLLKGIKPGINSNNDSAHGFDCLRPTAVIRD